MKKLNLKNKHLIITRIRSNDIKSRACSTNFRSNSTWLLSDKIFQKYHSIYLFLFFKVKTNLRAFAFPELKFALPFLFHIHKTNKLLTPSISFDLIIQSKKIGFYNSILPKNTFKIFDIINSIFIQRTRDTKSVFHSSDITNLIKMYLAFLTKKSQQVSRINKFRIDQGYWHHSLSIRRESIVQHFAYLTGKSELPSGNQQSIFDHHHSQKMFEVASPTPTSVLSFQRNNTVRNNFSMQYGIVPNKSILLLKRYIMGQFRAQQAAEEKSANVPSSEKVTHRITNHLQSNGQEQQKEIRLSLLNMIRHSAMSVQMVNDLNRMSSFISKNRTLTILQQKAINSDSRTELSQRVSIQKQIYLSRLLSEWKNKIDEFKRMHSIVDTVRNNSIDNSIMTAHSFHTKKSTDEESNKTDKVLRVSNRYLNSLYEQSSMVHPRRTSVKMEVQSEPTIHSYMPPKPNHIPKTFGLAELPTTDLQAVPDVNRIAEKVCTIIENNLRMERERRGIF